MTEPLTTKNRLSGKMMMNWCERIDREYVQIHFDRAMCDGLQNIRFTSDAVDAVFPRNRYHDGYILFYELCNTSKDTLFTVKADKTHIGKRNQKILDKLVSSVGAVEKSDKIITLKSWNISEETQNISKIPEVLQQIFDYELSYFETELRAWLIDHDRKIKSFPQSEQEIILNTELPDEILIEGAMRDILTNQYERNPKARARCIAHYGTACMVCGVDFGALYGEAFAGKIEVHHRKPLYEIKEDYVVDPVRDLIPVCPNCHMVIHSKKDGVYTAEEVKAMLLRKDVKE